MTLMPELSEIKVIRKSLNISQKELGEILNIPQSTISRIENGSMDPPYSKIKKIYTYLQKELAKSKESTIRAENIMTKKIFSINSDSTVKHAVEIMNYHKISQVPIIDNEKNVGSLTAKKIQKLLTENSYILNMKVNVVKELPFPEVEKNWGTKEISNLLLNYPAVLVKDINKYVGIITDADFLKLTKKYNYQI
jgi:predicted transcriptional regulator